MADLPIFPLNMVLFPGCQLDLQIFEARYLDMIGQCMKQGSGFGVVCIIKGDETGEVPGMFSRLGCEARIVDFQQQANGLLGIRVEGGRRFSFTDYQVRPDRLVVAQVQWLDEHRDQPLQEEDEDLLALLKALAEHPLVEALGMGLEPQGQQALAYQLAYLLPFSEREKVHLLEIADPDERLERIQTYLEQLQGDNVA